MKPIWKKLILLFVLLTIAWFVVMKWSTNTSEERWRAVFERVMALEEEMRQWEPENRVPAWGEAVDVDSRTAWQEVADLAEKFYEKYICDESRRPEYLPVLAAVKRAARSRWRPYRNVIDLPRRSMKNAGFGSFVDTECRVLLAQGKNIEAARLQLARFCFVRDLIDEIVLDDEPWFHDPLFSFEQHDPDSLRLHEFGVEGLAELARGLERLDRPLASPRVMAGAWGVSLARTFDQAQAARGTGYKVLATLLGARRRECDALVEFFEHSLDAEDFRQHHHERLRALVSIRLLRVAVAELQGRRLELADPFGDQALGRRRLPSGRVSFWSVGRNGKDDGKWRVAPEERVERSDDIVFDLNPK